MALICFVLSAFRRFQQLATWEIEVGIDQADGAWIQRRAHYKRRRRTTGEGEVVRKSLNFWSFGLCPYNKKLLKICIRSLYRLSFDRFILELDLGLRSRCCKRALSLQTLYVVIFLGLMANDDVELDGVYIPKETWLEYFIRFGLYFAAAFQIVCIIALFWTSTNRTTVSIDILSVRGLLISFVRDGF